MYCVCGYRATYLAGEMLCSMSDMIRLSAILTQITKGDYVSEKYEYTWLYLHTLYCITPTLSVYLLWLKYCRYNLDLLMQIKGQIAPPKCKVKVCKYMYVHVWQMYGEANMHVYTYM